LLATSNTQYIKQLIAYRNLPFKLKTGSRSEFNNHLVKKYLRVIQRASLTSQKEIIKKTIC